MITMNTNGKEEKTITYNPSTGKIIEELKLQDDYGFQVVKFKNNIYGINYINPTKGIQETVMVSTDAGINIGPISFLRFAKEAYKLEAIDISEIENVELAIYVDPENKEIYRETITQNEAKTLIEKLEISRELAEIRRENSWQYKYGDNIMLILIAISVFCVILAILNTLHTYGVI